MDKGRDFILITRPEEEARHYAAELEAEGFHTIVAPMLEIAPEVGGPSDLVGCRGLLFTSVNGVRGFAARCPERSLPVYAVGQYTAEEAKGLGFTDIHVAKGTGADLARLVASENRPGEPGFFLHVRGDHAALALDEVLSSQGFFTRRLVVYRSVPVQGFDQFSLLALREGRVLAVTFFSKRTAENFMKLAAREGLGDALKSIKALCISESVLECVQAGEWQKAYVCGRPDRMGMVGLLQQIRTENF